ncbi:MAG: hypothetical protein Q4C31_04800 [Eubacteriales bacterium]|nr:hypothetical protein [Eubacteriales bacterium]
MKNLWRSIISSSAMWLSYVLFGYFILIRKIFLTGCWNFLIFGNGGKNLLFSVFYFVGFTILTANMFKKALLPCYEALIRKQIIEKVTQIDWVRPESAGAFLPWPSACLRLGNEKGVYFFPDRLPRGIQSRRVSVLFLRRSKLVLQISVIS